MITRFVLALVSVSFLASCSGGAKKSEAPTDQKAASQPRTMSKEDILQKYSLQELNSVANALKVISDKNQDVLGCAIPAQKALSMTMPLKSLIDDQIRSEAGGYEQDPKAYASTEGFESCAGKCACGVFSDVVSAAQEGSMPKGSSVQHRRNMARLKAKAERQDADASLTCARKQSWFCSSELRAYLDKEYSENQ